MIISYYFVLPLILALLPSGSNANVFDDDRCYNEHHNVIDCPTKTETQKILSIAVPLGVLVLLAIGLAIHYTVKKRRARKAAAAAAATFVNLPNASAGAPQMEQGYAGQWVPPPQYPQNVFQDGPAQSYYAPPLGPPPGLAHGGSYKTGDPEKYTY